MGRHAAKHIANGFSLIRDYCGDVNKSLHIGIAGGSGSNYSTAVGVPANTIGPFCRRSTFFNTATSSVNEVNGI